MTNDAAVWVLIVDDQEMVRGVCEEVILSLGHRALTADSAGRALKIIEQQQVDIVIADIKMSGMSGIELLEQIKTTNPQIEVVIMTGYATVPSAVQAMKLGATDYITKPFSAEEIRLVVERLVQTLELKEENPTSGNNCGRAAALESWRDNPRRCSTSSSSSRGSR